MAPKGQKGEVGTSYEAEDGVALLQIVFDAEHRASKDIVSLAQLSCSLSPHHYH